MKAGQQSSDHHGLRRGAPTLVRQEATRAAMAPSESAALACAADVGACEYRHPFVWYIMKFGLLAGEVCCGVPDVGVEHYNR